MGLLSHIAGKSSFGQWAFASGFEHCALFCPVQEMMAIKKAYRTDAVTAASSVSTKDFWKGSLPENGWNYFLREDSGEQKQYFSNFLQFFSPDWKDRINAVAFIKIPCARDFIVFMLFSEKEISLPINENAFLDKLSAFAFEDEDYYSDYKKLIPESKEASLPFATLKATVFEFDATSFIEELLSSCKLSEPELKSVIENAVYEQIIFYLSRAFIFPNHIFLSENKKIKIALFTNESFSLDLLKSELSIILKEISGTNRSKFIVNASGKASSLKELNSFFAN